ncbi:MAG: amidohydrolase family protein [Candidatus Latescibacterota bacterium]
MVIDFHTHVFPDIIAPRAIASLQKQGCVKAASDGTVSGLLRSMDCAGIDRSVILPVSTRKEQVGPINRWITGIANDRIIPFGTLYPGMRNPEREAARLAECGIAGVKLHADYQEVNADDPVMFPLYEACRTHGLMAVMHAGFDIALSPPVRATPRMIAAVLDRFPGLRVVAAHMGGNRMWEEVGEHLVGRDVLFDTALFAGEIEESVFLAVLRAHGAGRVLFATDQPWLDQARAMNIMRDWALTDEERQLVLGGNAERLLQGASGSAETY